MLEKTYADWTVLGFIKGYKIFVRCKCGKLQWVLKYDLRTGKTTRCKSCKTSENNTTHGLSFVGKYHPLYNTWRDMWQRCTSDKSSSYKYYGARGIKVCDRWRNPLLFIEDMGEKPTPNHTLERINNDGNYEPSNCKWATWKEQVMNKRPRMEGQI